MDYEILYADSLGGLERKVQQYVSAGWKPQGGVAVSQFEYDLDEHTRRVEITIYQAMVREQR